MFKKRLKENTTWLGLSGILGGIGMLLKANGVPEAAQAMAANADQLAAGDYMTPLAMIIGGLIAAIRPDTAPEPKA